MKPIDWNQKKIEQLAEYIPELIKEEIELLETIQFVEAIGEKWKHRFEEKQTNRSTTEESIT